MDERQRPPIPTIEEIVGELAEVGVTHVGVAGVEVLEDARRAIVDRIERDLVDGMRFTFRNPDRSTDPGRSLPEARSVIVAARPYLTETEPRRPVGPHARVGRYAWEDHYAPLRAGLRRVGSRLKSAGHRAVAFADDNSMVDRAIAHRAGLGWYGKNANLLLAGAGSWFVLGSLVTTAWYPPAEAPVDDGCGSCRRCLDGCPTGAIIEPGVIDAGRCLSWVLQKPGPIAPEFRVAIHDRIYGCDDCQEVCPISVRLGPRATLTLNDDAVPWADVLWLLDATDHEIEQRHGRWYVADRDMRWLRRNALVVLGNVADPDDTRCREVLARYRAADDPVLAEHADWALRRLRDRSTPTSVTAP